MPPSPTRTLLLVFAGIASVAMLIASVALLIWVTGRADRPTPPPAALAAGGGGAATPGVSAAAATGPATAPAAPAGTRFTLRLGQGFRFRDGAVVLADRDARPDVVFKYLPPHVGGTALRYNPISQQVERGFEPTLTSPVPLLVTVHGKAFDARPDIARTTTGDAATYDGNVPILGTTRHVLLQGHDGEHYLLTLDELAAVPGKYDDWRIGFAFEKVTLPLGLAGGRIGRPLPGKLVLRDWIRSRMIVRVDLSTGKEEVLADGIVPTMTEGGVLAFGDTSGAYVVRDAAGKTLHTIRFNEEVLGPELSPDGKRLVGTVRRQGPDVKIGSSTLPGAMMFAAGVFDLEGREVASFPGYDDATWAPDGKLIATGAVHDPGLFDIDPATKRVTAIDAKVGAPGRPAVSPDGRTIAFVTGNRVWLIGRDGGGLKQAFPDGISQQRPAFSPDGTKLAMVVCNQFPNDSTGEVFVLDLATGEATPLRTSTGQSVLPDPTTRLNWVR